MDLCRAKDWAEIAFRVMSTIAIIAAGIWAYYQFNVTDTVESNIELAISTDTLPYSDKDRILLIHINPKNIGKVRVSPNHLTVTVRDFPSNLKVGEVNLEKLDKRYSTDILDRFKDGYDLEPGVTYDELWALIVPKDALYVIRAEVDFDDGENEVDQTIVVKARSTKDSK